MANKEKTTPYVSAFALFDKSLEAVKRNLRLFIILNILPLASTLANMRSRPDGNEEKFIHTNPFAGLPAASVAGIIGFGIVIILVFIALSLIVQAMLIRLQLGSAKDKIMNFDDLWPAARKYTLRLFGLFIVVGLMVFGGLLLFIVPGFIVIRRYFFAPFVMVDKDLSISEAMKESARLTDRKGGAVWGIVGVMLLIALVNILPIIGGIISLILSVCYSVAPALRYLELKKLASTTSPSPIT